MPSMISGGVGLTSASNENWPPEAYEPLRVTGPTTGSGGVVNGPMGIPSPVGFAGSLPKCMLAWPRLKPATVRLALPWNVYVPAAVMVPVKLAVPIFSRLTLIPTVSAGLGKLTDTVALSTLMKLNSVKWGAVAVIVNFPLESTAPIKVALPTTGRTVGAFRERLVLSSVSPMLPKWMKPRRSILLAAADSVKPPELIWPLKSTVPTKGTLAMCAAMLTLLSVSVALTGFRVKPTRLILGTGAVKEKEAPLMWPVKSTLPMSGRLEACPVTLRPLVLDRVTDTLVSVKNRMWMLAALAV